MRDVAILINSLTFRLNKIVDFKIDSGVVLEAWRKAWSKCHPA
jgi:hypothetical protein